MSYLQKGMLQFIQFIQPVEGYANASIANAAGQLVAKSLWHQAKETRI